ncbi:MAG: hypothetical protein A2V79_07690 [Betaproteobacteria bacterium RBG_16_56_24]|nr:MAG: hypothetical protein A2V79_07690 [Betaproteobacteria bacterium RBG_16_56_24]
MLSGIFGKKSDHPLADIRSAQKLLDELPKNDTHKLLMDLAELIESVTGNTGFKLDHQFALLCLFDEAAQPYARKLIAEYFAPRELNSFQESRLWLVLGNLSRQTAIAYCTLFDRYAGAEKGSNTIKAQAPLLMARAVHAMVWQLKYICAHYDLVEFSIWENLAHIFIYAERQQCLDAQVRLYPGSVGNTSVRCEAGRLLGWYGSGVSSLSPVHMHLTERILAQYCADIDVQAQQNQSSLFIFDLNDPDAPVRVKMNSTVSPSMRFVGMQAMQPKLELLMKTLEKDIVPEGLILGGNYGAELIKEAVRHLLTYFIGPPVRGSVRRAIKINFNVENSFTNVVERVRAGLNFSKERPVWVIEDISVNSFLTVLSAQGSDGMRIGGVLGMQLEGVPHWGVAVVRRLLRNDASQLHVGAEILATQVTGVALSQSGGGARGFEDGQLALWLNAKPGEASDGANLLMRAGMYSANRSLQTHLNGKNYLLIPNGLQEKYIDCDMARFRLVEQEEGEE